MASYRPDTPNLLHTVADFLARITPALDAGDRYQALVCQHILALIAREITTPPPEDDPALAAAIRAGAHDASWDALLEDLLRQAKARVAVVKPDHLTHA